jgi:hypothetical protein
MLMRPGWHGRKQVWQAESCSVEYIFMAHWTLFSCLPLHPRRTVIIPPPASNRGSHYYLSRSRKFSHAVVLLVVKSNSKPHQFGTTISSSKEVFESKCTS